MVSFFLRTEHPFFRIMEKTWKNMLRKHTAESKTQDVAAQ